jgi:hypothetical protein
VYNQFTIRNEISGGVRPMREKLLGATVHGTFWPIDDPSRKCNGVLAIDKSGSAKLKMQGDRRHLAALDRDAKYNIHGSVEDGTVTLFGCFVSCVDYLHDNADIVIDMVAVGALLNSTDETVITSIGFSTPDIIRWTGLRGLSRRTAKSSFTVKCKGKRTRSIKIGIATIYFGTEIQFSTSLNTDGMETRLLERHGVQLTFGEPQSVSTALRWALRTYRLLSFALRRPVSCSVYNLQRAS